MEITIKKEGDIVIFEISGNLDGTTAPEADEKIRPYVKESCKLILDMKQCEFVSSAGLRTLLIIAKLLKKNQGTGVLVGVSEEVKEVMEMTGFDDMFDTYATRDDAVKALKKGSS